MKICKPKIILGNANKQNNPVHFSADVDKFECPCAKWKDIIFSFGDDSIGCYTEYGLGFNERFPGKREHY